MDHQLKAKLWGYYAKISGEGVTDLGPGWLEDKTRGEILSFNHFVPRPRPKDAARAAAFDHKCAAIAAKCRTMQGYYERLRRKWEHAASHPGKVVPPDPPPPLPIEPSSFQDISD